MANVGAGVGLLIFGVFLTGVGGFAYSSCTSEPTVNGVAPDCGGLVGLIVFGVILLVAGVVVVAFSVRPARPVIQQVPDPSVPPPIIQPVVVQQTVEREVVKVRCPFCGNLCEVTAKSCPSCGAPIG